MLQPSPSPVHPSPASSFPTSEHSAPVSRATSSKTSPIWQWVSFRELLFVFLVCSFGVLLFRTKDSFKFISAWKDQIDTEHYSNREFPLEDEKLPPPIVTDLDSDGNQDMLILTNDNYLKQFTFPSTSNAYKPHDAVRVVEDVKKVSLSSFLSESKEEKKGVDEDGINAVAMGAGYLQQYQSMVQVRHQVVAVLMSDWTVLCFDHTLKLIWKVKVHENTEEEGISAKDAAVLVTSVNIHKGDSGSIIVGGRQEDLREPEESLHRMRRVVNEHNQDELLQLLGHFTVYALEGRGGEVRWHHTPQDFQVDTAYPTDQFSFRHLKLSMFRHRQHQGEVSWHQYSEALRKAMPHSWQYSTDTHFSLAHFKKDTRPSEKEKITHHISKVSDLAVEHISGLAFGGQRPHSPSEHVEDPNVLILRSIKGLEVMHLYQGRPLCSLPLSPFHSAHADINGDGVIDHISAIHNPGEGFVSEEGGVEGEVDCYGKAVSMNADSKAIVMVTLGAKIWYQNDFSDYVLYSNENVALAVDDDYGFYLRNASIPANPTNGSISANTRLIYMIGVGYVIPFFGLLSFFVVTFFWFQEFPIQLCRSMIKLWKSGDRDEVLKVPCCSSFIVEQKCFNLPQSDDVDKFIEVLDNNFDKLHGVSWFKKIVYPFVSPCLVVPSMVYTVLLTSFFLLGGFSLDEMSVLSFDIDGFILGAWAEYHFVAFAVVIIANHYVLLVGGFWLFVLFLVICVIIMVTIVIIFGFPCIICILCIAYCAWTQMKE